MGDLLLKGWRMLGEDCPLTGEVPLMQHPTSGRKFSVSAGQYTDEMDLSGTGSSPGKQNTNDMSPQPATHTNGADACAAAAPQVHAVTSHLADASVSARMARRFLSLGRDIPSLACRWSRTSVPRRRPRSKPTRTGGASRYRCSCLKGKRPSAPPA
eukprot:scaffold8100_cov117-Isochrysis_galbana.AAC.3